MSGATVLLVGAEALALAPRLEASGYLPMLLDPATDANTETLPLCSPDAAVVAAGSEAAALIQDLRQQLGAIPILLDLGSDSLEARCHCLICGADDFWLSSLGASDLLMRLRLHLGLQSSRQAPQTVLQVADLVVNPTRRQVKRGGRVIALTAREYQLLVYLIERAGQVLSREAILGGIWSDQQGAASNVIEVYVRYLRQKLEAGGERRLIHTVRGRGYCLAAKAPPLHG
jgi:two-component system response regulator MprA